MTEPIHRSIDISRYAVVDDANMTETAGPQTPDIDRELYVDAAELSIIMMSNYFRGGRQMSARTHDTLADLAARSEARGIDFPIDPNEYAIDDELDAAQWYVMARQLTNFARDGMASYAGTAPVPAPVPASVAQQIEWLKARMG